MDGEEDVKRRIGLACAAFGGLGKMLREKSISIATKMKLYYALVVPVLLYGSECWNLRKEDERRLLVAEMSWLRSRGGDLGGTGGTVPQNLRWGDGPCIGPPNILRRDRKSVV